MNASVKVIGLDIAKNVFVAVGIDGRGKMVWKHKLRRDQVLATFAQLAPCAIGIEACAGSHYWARKLNGLGHDCRLIAAQHVRRFVSGNKNDTNDAAAIAEARSRAATRYVAINTEAQQDLQMLHRARQALVSERRAVICRIRAFAHEYGQVFPQGVAKLRKALAAWLGEEDNGLTGSARTTFGELIEQLDDKEARLEAYERRLDEVARSDEGARRLMAAPGIGKITATALVASVGAGTEFASGRHLAANLGVVPHEHSSGGKQRLFGITKRGDRYVRTLLIHGARSALRWAADKPDRILRWALAVAERRGQKVAIVALANKLARVAWALLRHGRSYLPEGAPRALTGA